MQVASAFSQMLNLHNLSEEISNAQIEKASRIGEVSCLPGPSLQHQVTGTDMVKLILLLVYDAD